MSSNVIISHLELGGVKMNEDDEALICSRIEKAIMIALIMFILLTIGR